MKCSNCGTQNSEGAAYCANCGASLEAPRDAGAARPVSPASAPAGNSGQANDTIPPTPVASAATAGSGTSSRMGGMGSMNAAMPSAAQLAQLRQVGSRLDPIAGPLQQPLAPLEAVGPRMLAWIGSALLALGFLIFPVFSFSFSIGGFSTSNSYRIWTYSHGQWLLYLLLTLASLALAYLGLYRLLLITGALTLLLALYGFFDGFGLPYVSHSFGWLIIFLGAIGILLAGIVRETAGRRAVTGLRP